MGWVSFPGAEPRCGGSGLTDLLLQYAGYLWPGIRDGYLVGPNVYSSLTLLSTTGGHGDEHELPLCAVKEFSEAGGSSYICDGVEECIKAVRTM